MKQVVALVSPSSIREIGARLQDCDGLSCVTFWPVKDLPGVVGAAGPKTQRCETADYPGSVRVEIYCSDEFVYEVVWILEQEAAARNEKPPPIYIVDVSGARLAVECEPLVAKS